MKDYILILTNKDDESIEPVIEELKKIKANFFRFNTESFPLTTTIELALLNGKPIGSLSDKNGNTLINWEGIKSVWYRRPASARIENEKLAEGLRKEGKKIIKAKETGNKKNPWQLIYA